MRTIQLANQNKQALDKKTRCWTRLEEYANVQDVHSKQLDGPKAAGSRGPSSTALNGSHQLLGIRTNNSDFILRPRQVVLQTSSLDKGKGSNGRTLVKSNSLPPIYGSKVTSIHGGKAWVPSRLREHEMPQMGKKTNISTVSLRRDRALIWRQKEGGQFTSTVGLICNSLATFTVTEHSQNLELGLEILSRSALDQSSKILGLEENSPITKDSGVITEGNKDSRSMCRPKQHTRTLSDSAIETETQSAHRKGGMGQERKVGTLDQEEEYYTSQRIIQWIIGVNASLFSTSKDELNKPLLKEEDVDTIKIVYGQD
ncbi:hypothetical protein MHYP_G00325860 [Metynnis hypsauchen]